MLPHIDTMHNLCDQTEAFYHTKVEHPLNGRIFHMFNYRLMSYQDTLYDGALEARGILYDDDGNVVCAPPHKFFNYAENPHTMELPPKTEGDVFMAMDKEDGSLVSSYLLDEDTGKIRLKSRGSLTSSQAYMAYALLNGMPELYAAVVHLTQHGYTVNMEYCAPTNRIVLHYPEETLKVLNIRGNETGNYYKLGELGVPRWCKYPLADNWVDRSVYDIAEIDDFIENAYNETGKEGYVVVLPDDRWMKIKTDWYATRHRIRDSISTNKNIAKAVINGESDDIRAIFRETPAIIQTVDQIEERVTKAYNSLVADVGAYFEANKHEDRKTYAIRGKEHLDKTRFNLAMSLYSGKTPDYKEMFLKHLEEMVNLD